MNEIEQVILQSDKYSKVVRAKQYKLPQGWEQAFPTGGDAEFVAGFFVKYKQKQKSSKDPYWINFFSAWTEEHWLEYIAYVKSRQRRTNSFLTQTNPCQFSLSWYCKLFGF